MPYQGNNDLMIDKYDGRALLATLEPLTVGKRVLTEEEADLESQLNYERYRSIIEAKKRGEDEATLLKNVREELLLDNKFAPTHKEMERTKSLAARETQKRNTKQGQYSAVKLNYNNPEEDTNNPETDSDILDTSDSSEFSEDSNSGGGDTTSNQIRLLEETPEEMERGVNDLAGDYDIDDYCRMVRMENRDLQYEKKRLEEEAMRGGKKLSRRERRRLRDKDRRRFRKSPTTRRSGPPSYARRGSPTYESYMGKDRRRSSRSNSPRRRKPKKLVGTKEYITEFRLDNRDDSDSESESEPEENEKKEMEESERIREATEAHDDSTAILRRPGDRWNFARAIDEKYNQPRYKMKFREDSVKSDIPEKKIGEKNSTKQKIPPVVPKKEIKKREETTGGSIPGGVPAGGGSVPVGVGVETKKETPQERLKRKMRQQLNRKIKADRRETRRKEAQQAAERRRREEEMLEYNYGLRRSSPDYYRGGGPRSSRSRSRSSVRRSDGDGRSRSRGRSQSRDRRRGGGYRSGRSRSRSRDRRKRSPSRDRRRRSRSYSQSRSREARRHSNSRSRSPTRDYHKRKRRSLSPTGDKPSHNNKKQKYQTSKPASTITPSTSTSAPPPSITTGKTVQKTKYDLLMAQLDDLEKKHAPKEGSSPNLQDYNLPTSFI